MKRKKRKYNNGGKLDKLMLNTVQPRSTTLVADQVKDIRLQDKQRIREYDYYQDPIYNLFSKLGMTDPTLLEKYNERVDIKNLDVNIKNWEMEERVPDVSTRNPIIYNYNNGGELPIDGGTLPTFTVVSSKNPSPTLRALKKIQDLEDRSTYNFWTKYGSPKIMEDKDTDGPEYWPKGLSPHYEGIRIKPIQANEKLGMIKSRRPEKPTLKSWPTQDRSGGVRFKHDSTGDFLTELTHSHQEHNLYPSGEYLDRVRKEMAIRTEAIEKGKDPGLLYKNPKYLEYEAHTVLEPRIRRDFATAPKDSKIDFNDGGDLPIDGGTLPEFTVVANKVGNQSPTYKNLYRLQKAEGKSPYNMWNKYGRPNYIADLEKGDRSTYQNNTIRTPSIPQGGEILHTRLPYPYRTQRGEVTFNNSSTQDFLAELSHAKQDQDMGPAEAYKRFQDDVKEFGHKKSYNIPGTIEFDAHYVIEPKLRKEFKNQPKNVKMQYFGPRQPKSVTSASSYNMGGTLQQLAPLANLANLAVPGLGTGLSTGMSAIGSMITPTAYPPARQNENPYGMQHGGVIPRGNDQELSSGSYQVKYPGNETDAKSYGQFNFDKDEVIDTVNNFVYSDEESLGFKGKSPAKMVKPHKNAIGKAEKKLASDPTSIEAANTIKLSGEIANKIADNQETIKYITGLMNEQQNFKRGGYFEGGEYNRLNKNMNANYTAPDSIGTLPPVLETLMNSREPGQSTHVAPEASFYSPMFDGPMASPYPYQPGDRTPTGLEGRVGHRRPQSIPQRGSLKLGQFIQQGGIPGWNPGVSLQGENIVQSGGSSPTNPPIGQSGIPTASNTSTSTSTGQPAAPAASSSGNAILPKMDHDIISLSDFAAGAGVNQVPELDRLDTLMPESVASMSDPRELPEEARAIANDPNISDEEKKRKLSKLGLGDYMQMASLIPYAATLLKGPEKEMAEQLQYRQINSDPINQRLREAFNTQLSQQSDYSYNVSQASRQNAYANYLSQIRQNESNIANQNKASADQIDRINMQERSRVRDINAANRAQFRNGVRALSSSVGNMGRAFSERATNERGAQLLGQTFPDVFEYLMKQMK